MKQHPSRKSPLRRPAFALVLALMALCATAQEETISATFRPSATGALQPTTPLMQPIQLTPPDRSLVADDSISLQHRFEEHFMRDLPASNSIRTEWTTSPYTAAGTVATWTNGGIWGTSSHLWMPTLLDRQAATLTAYQQLGHWSLEATAGAQRYFINEHVRQQFLLGGALTYTFSPQWSATLFGQYASQTFFASMAAYPYLSYSSYGGYVNYSGRRAGIKLGMQQDYDPVRGNWQWQPIVTPRFRIGRAVIELPVGPLVGEGLRHLIYGKRPPYGLPPLPRPAGR